MSNRIANFRKSTERWLKEHEPEIGSGPLTIGLSPSDRVYTCFAQENANFFSINPNSPPSPEPPIYRALSPLTIPELSPELNDYSESTGFIWSPCVAPFSSLSPTAVKMNPETPPPTLESFGSEQSQTAQGKERKCGDWNCGHLSCPLCDTETNYVSSSDTFDYLVGQISMQSASLAGLVRRLRLLPQSTPPTSFDTMPESKRSMFCSNQSGPLKRGYTGSTGALEQGRAMLRELGSPKPIGKMRRMHGGTDLME